MIRAEQIVEALGGRRILKRRVTSLDDLRETVRVGLPFASLEAVMEKFGLERAEAARAIRLPQRTIARRKQERRLRAEESDRLVRLARLGAQAAQLFGSEGKAVEWLRRPNRALGRHAPLELLDSDLGARQVEDVLGRIQHGVIS
jgi:putative toxin-antitoxin system antitoxin component (TIGR02293 family)